LISKCARKAKCVYEWKHLWTGHLKPRQAYRIAPEFESFSVFDEDEKHWSNES